MLVTDEHREMAARLRLLMHEPLNSDSAVDLWQRKSREFKSWFERSFPGFELPLAVLVFLDEAELRRQHPEFDRHHKKALAEIIAELEAGHLPRPSCSPRLSSLRQRVSLVVFLILVLLYAWAAYVDPS